MCHKAKKLLMSPETRPTLVFFLPQTLFFSEPRTEIILGQTINPILCRDLDP